MFYSEVAYDNTDAINLFLEIRIDTQLQQTRLYAIGIQPSKIGHVAHTSLVRHRSSVLVHGRRATLKDIW